MSGRAVIDMVGVRVGTRVVIERAPRTTDVKTPGARWLVRCDCGATSIVRGSVLRRGTRGLTCVECQARDHTNADPSYATLHSRLLRTRGNTDSHVCVICGNQAAEWALSWRSHDLRLGTVGGSRVTFSRNLSDYEPLCRPHHRERDRSPESRAKRAALEAARGVRS